MSGQDYYVYLHRRADNNEVFYVGKGKNNRATCRKRNPHWKNTEAKYGLFIEYVETGLSEESAFDLEKELIRFYRDCGHPLTNMTDGGEGFSGYVMTEGQRRKLSAAKMGVKKTEETRKKMSENRPKKAVKCSNGMTFPSIAAAAAWVSGISPRKPATVNIGNCCRGTTQTAYGFRWRFLTENGETDESLHDCKIDEPIVRTRRASFRQSTPIGEDSLEDR